MKLRSMFSAFVFLIGVFLAFIVCNAEAINRPTEDNINVQAASQLSPAPVTALRISATFKVPAVQLEQRESNLSTRLTEIFPARAYNASPQTLVPSGLIKENMISKEQQLPDQQAFYQRYSVRVDILYLCDNGDFSQYRQSQLLMEVGGISHRYRQMLC